MDTIIAYRVGDGKPQFVLGAEGELEVFSHQDDAIDYAFGNALFQSGQACYQIISLDDL